MLICAKCQKEIKYMVGKNNEIYTLDPTLKTIVTERGAIIKGYSIHKCDSQGIKNDKR